MAAVLLALAALTAGAMAQGNSQGKGKAVGGGGVAAVDAQGNLRQAAHRVSYEGIGQVHDAPAEPAVMDDHSEKDEERDGKKRKRLGGADHALYEGFGLGPLNHHEERQAGDGDGIGHRHIGREQAEQHEERNPLHAHGPGSMPLRTERARAMDLRTSMRLKARAALA